MPGRKAYGYYGVVLKQIAIHTKRSARDLHEFFKMKFNPVKFRIGNEVAVIGGTTRAMSPEQFADYLAQIRDYAATDLGLLIPDPQREAGA